MKVTLTNISPYDGVYDLGENLVATMTTTEWEWVKRFSGYLPLTFDAGIEGGDPTLLTTLALIGLYRNGKVVKSDVGRVYEILADHPPFGGAIVFDPEERETEVPPTSAPAENSASGESASSSGAPSSEPTEIPADLPDSTGDPNSETAVASPSPISVT